MATRIDLVEDVLPISELRLRAAEQITKIKQTRRPLVITQYGKAVAVLMEVAQFQKWQDRLAYLEERSVQLEQQVAELNRARVADSAPAVAPNSRPAEAPTPLPDGDSTGPAPAEDAAP